MNRLPSLGSDVSDDGFIQVKENPVQLRERTPLDLQTPHRLFFPQHFEPRYDYPLFVWLHSQNSSEYELDEVIPSVSMRNYIAIGLRGPRVCKDNNRLFAWSLRQDCLPVTEEIVLESVRSACDDLPVNAQRVFIGGYGMGGSVAQWIALRYPQLFAGAVSINGPVPDQQRLLVRWKEAKKVPVLFMYGDSSELCPPSAVMNTVALVHRSSLNYQFAQFNCGDSLDGAMTSMANRFLMEATVQG